MNIKWKDKKVVEPRNTNMKKLIISLLIFIPLQIVSGQDKIITIQNDTIHCRIVSFTPTHIQYEQKTKKQNIVNRFIPKEYVLSYYRNLQSAQIKPDYRIDRPKSTHRWLAGIQTGNSIMTASTDDSWRSLILNDMGMNTLQSKDINQQLNRGWHLNGDIYYTDSDNFGLGVKYSFFTSSAQKDFITKAHREVLPTFVCVGLKENLYIHYIGPSMIIRQWLDRNQKFQLTEMFSAGYVWYRDEFRIDATFNFDNAVINSNKWGVNCGISFNPLCRP